MGVRRSPGEDLGGKPPSWVLMGVMVGIVGIWWHRCGKERVARERVVFRGSVVGHHVSLGNTGLVSHAPCVRPWGMTSVLKRT